ncbi:MAG: hypothetical protein Q4G40_03420 [Brachybacterium sp.]|nr:hypothetical protein [Brachybacterium sp.]
MTTPEDPRDRDDDRPADDIDAEFARMMEGIDLDDPTPDTSAATGNRADDGTPAAEDGPAIPDDAPLTVEDVLDAAGETGPGGGEPPAPPIAVIATSVASAKALAGAIRLGQEARDDGARIPEGTRIHATESGAIAVGALDEAGAHDLAGIVSTALQRHGIVLFWRRGERMTATRYRAGERGDDVSPALVLGAVDDTVEQLLLGAADAEDLGEGLDPSAITRMQALTWIATGRKRR